MRRRDIKAGCAGARDSLALPRQTRKPFGLSSEGLARDQSRGDRTRLELFVAEVRSWEFGLRRRLDVLNPRLLRG
jgi:hypothetical protein